MLNLFYKTKPALGLDVSGLSLKLVLLDYRRGAVSVKGYAKAELPKGLLVNDAIVDGKTFAFLVKKAMEKPAFGRFDTNRCVASLPESKSFVRVIQIPKMSEAEAASAIPFEAESFIPLPIDQVYLDWQKLSDTGEKMNVLIIATPRDYVDRYLSVLDQAGLKPVALEVESQSYHRNLIPKDSEETALMVDMDAFRSSLVMVERGSLQFTSTIPIAGNSFTESIARALGVSSAKAEEVKKKVGIANTAEYPNIKTSMLPVLNNLSAEIKNILKFHAERSESQVGKLLLTGGSAKLKNLPEFLALQLPEYKGLKIELGDPWKNLPGLANPPMDSYEALDFATAIGLAMRGANL